MYLQIYFTKKKRIGQNNWLYCTSCMILLLAQLDLWEHVVFVKFSSIARKLVFKGLTW